MIVIAGMGACTIEGGGYALAAGTASPRLGAGFGLLHTAAGRVGALELGFATRAASPRSRRPRPSCCSCSASTRPISRPSRFRIQGLYRPRMATRGARAADVILPGSPPTPRSRHLGQP